MKNGTYRYRITSTDASSSRYGNCEVCGNHVTEVHYQVEERYYIQGSESGWTRYKCHSLFGHKECLLNSQKTKETN
jgi:hypothetical protein